MTCQWICTSLRSGLLHPRCLILVVFLASLVWPTALTTPAQEKSKPEGSQSASNTTYAPTPANQAARKWFQDAKFGMFIHWGVYSVLGEGEWVMNEKKIPISEYEKIPPQFNPTEFSPSEWVALAKAAGMKYITITSKHHDGFAMFDSKVSDYDIMDRTPHKKDVLKMLADECRKQGIKLFFYHSQLDWHHPDYFPLGRTGHSSGRAPQGDWYKYLDYMDGQLRELLTAYGEVGGIWFDGWWDKPDADWRLDKTYKLIHDLQPQALIGNNHHQRPFAGEDFQMFEKDLPGGRTAEFNKDSEIGSLPLETCETINKSWGYNKSDSSFKSEKELLQYLIRAAGHNANFLLNVGPLPTGKIQPDFVNQLKLMGRWMAKYGDSIYGTRGGPIAPRPWGVTTQKGKKVYFHILDWQDSLLPLPKMHGIIRSAKILNTGRKADIIDTGQGLVLNMPEGTLDSIDTILELEM